MIKPKPTFYPAYESHINFSLGKIDFSAHSYEIDTAGHCELTEEQTKEFFLAMYNHYVDNNDKFWENQEQ